MRFYVRIGPFKLGLLPVLHLLADDLEQRGHPPLVGALHVPRASHVVDKFLDAAPGVLDLLHLGEGMEPVGDVGHQTAFVGLGHVAHVLHIEQLRDADLLVGDVESHLHVAPVVRLVERIVVDQVRAVDVEQGAEGEAVVPAGAEVSHIHLVVAGRLALAPQEKTFLGCHALLVDVVDGEAENQGPYQAQDDLAVAVDDVLSADVGHLDTAGFDKVEGGVCVFKALHAQLRFGGIAAERLAGEAFEEVDEHDLGERLASARGIPAEVNIRGKKKKKKKEKRTPSDRSCTRSLTSRLRASSLVFSHLVNVFCWTVIQRCCSAKAILLKTSDDGAGISIQIWTLVSVVSRSSCRRHLLL